MNGKKIIFNNDALSVVVSGLLSIIIVTSTIGTILTVGVPLVNTINAEKNKNNIELQFNSLFNSIADISKSSKIGDTKQINFQLDKDSQLVVNEEKDVSVFMYSLNPSYEFSVSGLDNGDNSFYVKMLDGSLTNADIFWLFNPETCFLAGTKILMFDGNYKNIEDIKVGDFVKSYNIGSGKIENCKVIKTFVHQPDEMPAFYLLLNNYLKVTPNHRFYSEGNWVFAGNLKIGDKLFSYNNLDDYFIYSIKKVYNRVTTFDLEIEKSHTYFVSINQKIDVLVHNGGEKNQAPRTPTLMEPTDGATDISIQPTLIWRGGDDDIEDFVQYQIYYGLSDNPPLVYTTDFFPGEIQDFEYAIEEPLVFSSIYCWKIIAIDKLGATSESLVFTFRTESDDLLPVADFTYSPNFPNQGQTVYFDASISQGNIIEYEWDFDGQGYKPGGITPTYSWQSSGSKTVKLKVTDDRNNIAYKTKTITINQRPSVTISSPASGATVSGSILITGSASDSDGSIVSVQVSIDNTNNWHDASITYESFPNVIWEYTWDSTEVNDGMHSIKARSLDNNGAYSIIQTVNVEVDNYLAPSAHFTWSPTSPNPNELVYFDASSSQPQNGATIVSYEWDWNNDGIYDESHINPTVTHSWSNRGSYPVSLKVIDSNNEIDTISFEILVNAAPSVTISLPIDESEVSGSVLISGTANDDVEINRVEIKLNNGAWIIATGTNNWQYEWVTSTNGLVNIKVRALDSEGKYSDEIMISVYVSNEILPDPPQRVIENNFIYKHQIDINVVEVSENLFQITSIDNLVGTVVIDLYDDDIYIGSIWYFDSNSISCDIISNDETKTNLIFESNGLIQKINDKISIKNPSINIKNENTLSISAIQLIKSFSSVSTASGSNSKISFTSKGNGMTKSDVYNNIFSFKMQFYGGNSATWVNYYDDQYDFEQESLSIFSENIISLKYNIDTSLSLFLFHSFIEFSIN